MPTEAVPCSKFSTYQHTKCGSKKWRERERRGDGKCSCVSLVISFVFFARRLVLPTREFSPSYLVYDAHMRTSLSTETETITPPFRFARIRLFRHGLWRERFWSTVPLCLCCLCGSSVQQGQPCATVERSFLRSDV